MSQTTGPRAFSCEAGPKDLSQVEVKHPEEVLRKGEKVRCFVKQLLAERLRWEEF